MLEILLKNVKKENEVHNMFKLDVQFGESDLEARSYAFGTTREILDFYPNVYVVYGSTGCVFYFNDIDPETVHRFVSKRFPFDSHHVVVSTSTHFSDDPDVTLTLVNYDVIPTIDF